MPEKRQHRGPHPEDARLFAPECWERLRCGVADLSWLLTQRYAHDSALKLVGDHFNLDKRQRIAVMRCACSDQAQTRRKEHELRPDQVAHATVALDGFNIITTVEAALGGSVLLRARDQCLRDMASMHGSYRKVAETRPAVDLIGTALLELQITRCVWLLDRPVSNSGRLKVIILEWARTHDAAWSVEVVPSPDHDLIASPEVVVTADSVILDRCARWFNLGHHVVRRGVPAACVVDLSNG